MILPATYEEGRGLIFPEVRTPPAFNVLSGLTGSGLVYTFVYYFFLLRRFTRAELDIGLWDMWTGPVGSCVGGLS